MRKVNPERKALKTKTPARGGRRCWSSWWSVLQHRRDDRASDQDHAQPRVADGEAQDAEPDRADDDHVAQFAREGVQEVHHVHLREPVRMMTGPTSGRPTICDAFKFGSMCLSSPSSLKSACASTPSCAKCSAST